MTRPLDNWGVPGVGRSGSDEPSGSRPTDGAASVSTADAASIPNAESDNLTSDEEFERVMDTLQLIIAIKEGHVLTEQEAEDIRFLEAYYREQDERATEAFDRGYQYGLKRGGGADTAKLIEERDAARTRAQVANAISSAADRWGFIRGAQVCREMMARFVEAVDPVTANSIRLNWSPSWGDDPGNPSDEVYAAGPSEISAKPKQVSA